MGAAPKSPALQARKGLRDPEPQADSGADALVELDEEDMGWAAGVCVDAQGRALQTPRAQRTPATLSRQPPGTQHALQACAGPQHPESQAGGGADALVELTEEDMGGADAGAGGAALQTPRAASAPIVGPHGPAQGVHSAASARAQPQQPGPQARGSAQRLVEPAGGEAGCEAGACMDAKSRAVQVLRARGAPPCRQACLVEEEGRAC